MGAQCCRPAEQPPTAEVVVKTAMTEADVKAALADRGITDERLVNGLLIAFDKNHDGELDSKEIDALLGYIDEQNAKPTEDDGVPWDCKAIVALAKGKGPPKVAGNSQLKMLLSSAGLMPKSSGTQLKALADMRAKTPGNGVMYLINARLPTLQFHLHNADPEKHNQKKHVAYKRNPDKPGGTPVKDKAGNVVLKSEAELDSMGEEGYAGVAYTLRKHGHYANAHCGVLAGGSQGSSWFGGGKEIPVYVAYLFYLGDVENGEYQHKILVAQGVWKDGKYHAKRSDTGKLFSEADYNLKSKYGDTGDHWFKETTAEEFHKVFDTVQVVYGCGGVPYLPILHFQPDFIDETGKYPNKPNGFGRALLDNVKEGKVTYVGSSAGAMVWGWSLGPLSTDPQVFMLNAGGESHGDEDKVDLGPTKELSRLWLFPGLGQYIGIPYDMTLKAHVQFSARSCSFGGTAAKAENASKVVSAVAKHDKYVALLTDYDWYAGQGDLIEVSDGKIFYHVGHCDKVDKLPDEHKAKLKEMGHGNHATIRKQPPGVPKEGLRFEWKPEDGEVIAAGPKATKFPWRMYADSNGPLPDAPPHHSSK